MAPCAASPPLRLEHRFRPVQAKGFGAAGHSACVVNPPATLRDGGSGAQCGDCNKDTRSWPRSTHVRWLYNLKRAANAAAVFDGFFFGQSQRGFLAWWFPSYLLLEIWSFRREGRANTQSSRRPCHLVASYGGGGVGAPRFFLTGFQKELSWK